MHATVLVGGLLVREGAAIATTSDQPEQSAADPVGRFARVRARLREARRWWAGRPRWLRRAVMATVTLVAVLLVTTVALAYRTVTQLERARDELDAAALAVLDRDTDLAGELLDGAEADIGAARRSVTGGPARLMSAIPGLGSPLRAARDAADAGSLVVTGTRSLVAAAEALPTSGLSGVDGTDLGELHDAAVEASSLIDEATRSFVAARATMQGPAGSWLWLVSGPSSDLLDTVDAGLVRLDNGQRALELAARLSAPEADERVLLLAMNSLEQRPIGGFFGSFGVLTFSGGQVELERFASVEALELTDPPMEIPAAMALALPNKRYGIENAGFFPVFPRVGSEAKELFRRQGGGDVTAVMAISEDLVQDLLGVFGPITVPGYEQPVTKEGFEGRVLFETEIKQPSDNPRKKFLIELSKIVFDRLMTVPADQVPAVGEVFANAVGRGEMLVWFADPELQSLVEGTLAAGEFPQTTGDFFALTDSNMTRSKANKDLHRTILYRLDHDRGRNLRVRVELLYENRGAFDDLINPYYNGFVQVYVPVDAELVVLPDPEPDESDDGIADGTVSAEVIADPGDWDDDGIDELTGYRSFSRNIIVEPGERRSMVLEYLLPDSVAGGGNYTLTVLRQPGTPNDLIDVQIGERVDGVPNQRETRFEADLDGNPVVAWMSRRWIVDRLNG